MTPDSDAPPYLEQYLLPFASLNLDTRRVSSANECTQVLFAADLAIKPLNDPIGPNPHSIVQLHRLSGEGFRANECSAYPSFPHDKTVRVDDAFRRKAGKSTLVRYTIPAFQTSSNDSDHRKVPYRELNHDPHH